MNPYNFCTLFFAFCSLILGMGVFLNRQDRIGKGYFVFSLSIALWGIAFSIMIADNANLAISLTASRTTCFTATFIAVTWFHLTILYAGMLTRLKKCLVAAYMISLPIAVFAYSGKVIFSVRPILDFKNYSAAGPLYFYHFLIFHVFVAWGFFNLVLKLKKSVGVERTQTVSFILATGAGFIGGSPLFLPVFGIEMPQYGVFLMPLYPFFMAHAIMKRQLFNPENMAQVARRDKMAAMGMLAASINHEVRSPLFVIRGLAETFMTQKAEGALAAVLVDQAEKGFQKTIQQTDRAMGMIKRLSTFAKREVDAEYAPQAVNVRQLLEDLFPLLRHELDSLAVQVTVSVPQDLKPLQADPGYLEEIVFNLMVNALQALKQVEGARTLELKAEPMGDGVSIRIADNGPGIAKDQLGLIFQPFYSTKEEGTGLGLYITKRLVEKCGGTIRVESVPGWGTQFILAFRAV